MKTFYNPRMVWHKELSSPSPKKPELVMKKWRQCFSHQLEQRLAVPCSKADLLTAHDVDFVEGVLGGTKRNGFWERNTAYAKTLLYTNGSMLQATKHAVHTREWACSPTSGFHHATHKSAAGFCTFNGLAMSALWARQAMKNGKQVLVLDCDYHYGDGTQDIFDKVPSDGITHLSAGEFFQHPGQSDAFLAWLGLQLECQLSNCGVVLYQAGADPHIDDPLGGFLTDDELSRRDHMVFSMCASAGVPLVWNLAGGYQEPIDKVLDIHTETMRLALKLEDKRLAA